MPARRNIIPTAQFKVRIPIDLKVKMDLHLHSDLRGRVPKAAHQAFIVQLLTEYFARISHDNSSSS